MLGKHANCDPSRTANAITERHVNDAALQGQSTGSLVCHDFSLSYRHVAGISPQTGNTGQHADNSRFFLKKFVYQQKACVTPILVNDKRTFQLEVLLQEAVC